MSELGRAGLIGLVSLSACVAIGGPFIRRLARAQGSVPARYEDCPPLLAYQTMKQGTPTMGGLLVLAIGILVAAAAGGLARWEGWLVCAAVIALGAIGWCDDALKFRGANAIGLRTRPKLFMALAVGAAIGLLSAWWAPELRVVEIPWGSRLELGWAWVPFAMVVLAGCAHAVNLTDGMDGLAAGCVAIALAVLGLWAAAGSTQHQVFVPWCASFAGACVGFLWFNGFPASIFMGDVGALGLGAALGTISLLMGCAAWLVIIGGVFVLEAVSVMLQVASYQWRGKRRVFRVAPIHHHFHLGGMNEPKVIVRLWIVGLGLALLGLTRRTAP